MMDVDQPVSSTTDTKEKEEGATLDADPSSQVNAVAKSPGTIVRENDDLPALLISDSEEEDNPPPPPLSKAPTKEVQTGDISGITPIETTVVNVQDEEKVPEEDDGSKGNGAKTVQETSLQSAAVDKEGEDLLMENIDLTGASSADDSGVSEEPSSEMTTATTTTTTTCHPVVTPKALTKSSSEMTAQELLESLLGAQEEAFASHRASELGAEAKQAEATVEPKASEEVDKKDPTSGPDKKITNNNPDSSSTSLKNVKDVTAENGSKIDTVVIDDECLLEEMSNVADERQQDMDIDDHHTASSNSSCGADGPNHLSKHDAEQANEEAHAGAEKKDDEDNAGPSRKKARSMDVVEDSTAVTTEPSFHGIEHDTVQNKARSHKLTNNSDNLNHAREQFESTNDVNSSAAEPMSAVDILEPKSTKPNDSSSSAAENGVTLKKQRIEVGGQQNVKPVEPSVCPEVLVIEDDDDDNAATSAASKVSCKNNLLPETQEMKQDTSEESKLRSVQTDDNISELAKVDSSVRLLPVPAEKMELKPIAMEFLRKFNKPIVQMTRTDLEQLVLQKFAEMLFHRSETAELRKIVKRQAAKLQHFERTIADMTTNYDNLKLVSDRAVLDMQKRAKSFVAPVKITRAVGLQVSRPATDTVSSHNLAHFSKLLSDTRKNAPVLVAEVAATNGAAENGEPVSSSEVIHQMTEPSAAAAAAPFPSVNPQNSPANTNRSQFSKNTVAMNATRFITSIPTANGMARTVSPQVAKQHNSVTASNLSITPGNAARLTANLPNDISVSSTPITAALANVSPKAGSASANPGGIDSTVRKKFHKFTPKRPPLSPYQQAQQEKQAKQQQELLVQQIHQQSQQVQQRKAQISVRQDVLQPIDKSVNRKRPMPHIQDRPLSATNPPTPATQTYQVVSYGAIRPVAASTLTNSPSTTPLQLSEDQNLNSQPTTGTPVVAASPPVNGSLIDLTDEDESTTSSIYIKRAKISHTGGQINSTPASSIPSSNVQTVATNQLVRIQNRINPVDRGADTVISPVTTNSSVGVVASYNNSNTAVRAHPPVNRPNNAPALQPVRQPVYNNNFQRIPASTDMQKKRIAAKPLLAPLPNPGPQPSDPSWKLPPPQPVICVNNVEDGIVISWTMPSLTNHHSNIETYQIYAYQEPSVQSATDEWRHVGDVKALLLPMAVTLTQFHEGQRYYFAVRAIDLHKRIGKFCEPHTWIEK